MPTPTFTTSRVVPAQRRSIPGFDDLRHIDLGALGVEHAPISLLDDFRVAQMPFSPHPHAGFGAVTYLFEDSPGKLRSRASTGEDVEVGPGGVVWTEAGRGVLHEEAPAHAGRALHGIQLFVNLSAANKAAPPRVLVLDGDDVPVWRGPAGDAVRVVSGAHGGVASPLDPIEPFTLLDAMIHRAVEVQLPAGHRLVVYALAGAIDLRAEGRSVQLPQGGTIAIAGDGRSMTLTSTSDEPSQVLVAGGAALDDPVVTNGPFIMNDQQQILDAIERYRRGDMGTLAPLPR